MNTKQVLEVLNDMQDEGVIQAYALGGAVGAAVYLEPFYTKDLDVFVALEKKATLIDLSAIYGYLTARGFETKGQWVVIGGWDVEFLPPYGPLTEQALREANVIPWENTMVRVMRPEHLVAICLETGRIKDYERIARFLEQAAFDDDALSRILANHGLLEKWERFMRRYEARETL
jgi:hypothetical protein